jgi:probable HAF family extracellular repeat protein
MSLRARLLASVLLTLGVALLSFSSRVTAQNSYVLIDLGSLGGQAGMAHSVNSQGRVVGWAYTAAGMPHAFLYDGAAPRDLGTLGGSFSNAYAINGAGQIAGEASTPGEEGHRAFLFDGTQMRNLGTLGGAYSTAYALNVSGRVVGASTTAGEAAFHAFLFDGSSLRDLGTLGGAYSVAYGVNKADHVVGWSYPSYGSEPHAFLHDGVRMRDLGTLGGSASMAIAINDAAMIVGGAFPSGGSAYHAFYWLRGRMRDLGTLGGSYSFARAVNASGHIVGESMTAGDGAQHAFLYTEGVMRDLNSLVPAGSGWVLTQALGINDSGQIVGVGTHGGQQRTFLLTLAPLQATPPAAPAAVSAQVVSARRIDLSWSDASANETSVAVWKRSAAADWGRVALLPADAIAYSDTDVAPGTAYSYRLQAANAAGVSPWSNEAQATTPLPPPAAPIDLAVRVITLTQFELNWADKSDNETTFALWRRRDGEDWARVAILPANSTRHVDSGLLAGAAYNYRVCAVGEGGTSDWSNTVTASSGLTAPTRLYVRNGAPYLIFVDWTDSSSGETGFELQRKEGDGVYRKWEVIAANNTGFWDYMVRPNTRYSYRVRALGPNGPSAWSNEVSWTTPEQR